MLQLVDSDELLQILLFHQMLLLIEIFLLIFLLLLFSNSKFSWYKYCYFLQIIGLGRLLQGYQTIHVFYFLSIHTDRLCHIPSKNGYILCLKPFGRSKVNPKPRKTFHICWIQCTCHFDFCLILVCLLCC